MSSPPNTQTLKGLPNITPSCFITPNFSIVSPRAIFAPDFTNSLAQQPRNAHAQQTTYYHCKTASSSYMLVQETLWEMQFMIESLCSFHLFMHVVQQPQLANLPFLACQVDADRVHLSWSIRT
eukprot:6462447-Amphidinium_carterae.2